MTEDEFKDYEEQVRKNFFLDISKIVEAPVFHENSPGDLKWLIFSYQLPNGPLSYLEEVNPFKPGIGGTLNYNLMSDGSVHVDEPPAIWYEMARDNARRSFQTAITRTVERLLTVGDTSEKPRVEMI